VTGAEEGVGVVWKFVRSGQSLKNVAAPLTVLITDSSEYGNLQPLLPVY